MSFDSLYASRVDANIDQWVKNPGPAPGPGSFSAWSAVKAFGGGISTGTLNSFGSDADLLSLFAGPASASYGAADTTGAVNQAQVEGARQKMLKGDSFDPTAGDALRRKADTFVPNPETSTRADQFIHGLSAGVSQAVGDAATLGVIPGAVKFGLEHGNDTGQRLRMDGVDSGTAAQVGAVDAAFSTVGAMLPAGGSTWLKTAGIATGAGPGSYMAQEALSKRILAEAGYKSQADQHDPFDPLGLATSIAVPAAFGALHMRGVAKAAETPVAPSLAGVVQSMESGGKRYGTDGQLLTSPKGAQGEMQVMPATATDPGFGVVGAKDNSPDELSRVGRDYLTAMQQRYPGEPDKALAAYNAGPGALDHAVAAHGDDWLAHLPDETKAYVGKGMKLLGQQTIAHAATDPEAVDAARVKVTNEALHQSLPGHPEALGEMLDASDEIAAGRTPDVREAPQKEVDLLTPEERAAGEVAMQPRIDEARLAKPAFDAKVQDFADAVGGVAKIPADVKSLDRSVEKMVAGGHTPDDIKDLVRATVAVDTPEAARAVLAELNDHFDVVRVKDRMDSPTSSGYRDILANVRLDNGRMGEVQISTHGMMAAKGVAHKLYKIERNLPEGDPRIAQLQEQQRQIYSAGFAARDLNSASEIGKPYANTRALSRYGSPSDRMTDPSGSSATGVSPTSKNFDPLGNETGFISTSKPIVRPSEAESSIGGQYAQRVAAVAEASPDMKVQLPGSDKTMTVTEALEQAKAEAAYEASEGDLLKAAIDCALSFGG